MSFVTRREFCRVGAGSVVTIGSGLSLLANSRDTSTCTLGYSTYALPNLGAIEAISFIRSLGFDSIEFTITADRSMAPERIADEDRSKVAAHLKQHQLQVTALMENLRPMETLERHVADCQRLERGCALATALRPDAPPLIQTVMGGGDWSQRRQLCLERVRDWLKIAEKHRVVIGIKPHRGHAMSKPEDAIWLIEKLGNPPWIRMVFDYSHFVFRDMPMPELIRQSLPYTSHIAVKDAELHDGKVQFSLPGESKTIDYVDLLKRFYGGGYRGDVCVEVSAQVWKKAGYKPKPTAKICYRNLQRAFVDAMIERPN